MELAGYIDKGIFGMSSLQVAPEVQDSDELWRLDESERTSQKYVSKAITRGVSPNIAACELTYRVREDIDFKKATSQLERYSQILRKWNVDLLAIPASDSHPDCCFVQDTAVVLDEVCVIASMG